MITRLALQSPSAVRSSAEHGMRALQQRWQYLSQRLERLRAEGHEDPLLEQARWQLYRAGYHGGQAAAVEAEVPVLGDESRDQIRGQLIEVENLIDRFWDQPAETIEALVHDFNGDGQAEARLANSALIAWVAPAAGGQLTSLDLRGLKRNALAPGRPSFTEHFWEPSANSSAAGDYLARDQSDFSRQDFHGQVRRGDGRLQLRLQRQGLVQGIPLRVSKALTLLAHRSELEVTYLIEGLPEGCSLCFASLWHWYGVKQAWPERYWHDCQGETFAAGHHPRFFPRTGGIGLYDGWLGLDMQLQFEQPAAVLVSPAADHSAVMPYWLIAGDGEGRWSTQFRLVLESSPHRQPG